MHTSRHTSRTSTHGALLALVVGLASCTSEPPVRRGFWYPDEGRVVDLTRTASRTSSGAAADAAGETRATTLICGVELAGGGTLGGTLDQIEPGRCVAPLVVIDVRERNEQAPEFVFTAEDLAEYEARRGEIPAGALVVLATGGGRRADSPAGAERPGRLQHPGFSPGVVELLVRQRGAIGCGTDAPALEASSAAAGEATRGAVTLGAFVVTDLARLDQLPDGRAILLLAPPPEPVRSRAVRVFALAPRTVGRGSS